MLTPEDLAKLKSEVHLGTEIAALIDNSVVKGAMTGLLNSLQNTWLVTQTAQERELLWQKALGVQEFVAALRTIVDTGKMAAHQLAAEAAIRNGNDDQES